MSNRSQIPTSAVKRFLASAVLGLCAFVSPRSAIQNGNQTKPAEPLDLPDLTIQSLTVSPASFQPGQPVTITAIIKNIGANYVSAGFYSYLYVDPPQQPPTASTTPTTPMGWFFGLAPGAVLTLSRTSHVFMTPGCDHQVYAWTDRDNTVAESNESNNLSWIDLCVGSQGNLDAYEPADNTCETGTSLPVNAAPQQHNFYPVGDKDWYKVSLLAGTSYAISVLGQSPDFSSDLLLLQNCDQAGSLGAGTVQEFVAPATGQYYIRAKNASISSSTQTSYTIALISTSDCSGFYEPNDTRPTAWDIAPGDPAQTHTFCKQGDEDWARLNAAGGYTYVVRAEPGGTLAQPTLQLYSASGDHLSSGNPLAAYSPSDTVFFVRSASQNSSATGPDTRYQFSVSTAQGCTPDAFESDNTLASAKPVTLNAAPQSHTTCPAGDIDWSRFDATSGEKYSIEAAWAGQDAKTQVCITNNGGVELSCDQGNLADKGARINWIAPTSGAYFVKAKHSDAQTAGSSTRYLLSVSSGACAQDAYEPDDSTSSAKTLAADGSFQDHNFCPQNDVDMAKLVVQQAGVYAIETSNLGPGTDTVISVLAQDGITRLVTSDDYANGLASRLVYTFSTSGLYYVQVQDFNPAHAGSTKTYRLSTTPLVLFPGGTPTVVATATPTPSLTPTAPPTPTPTPPAAVQASTIKTLIVTNRAQLEAIYGSARTAALFDKLNILKNQPSVLGEIVDVNQETVIHSAYDIWASNATNIQRANDISSIIRIYLSAYYRQMPSLQYVVIVGDDRVIPFRRILDKTRDTENLYLNKFPFLTSTALGATFANKYFLSDDYYAALQANTMGEQEVFLPSYGLGRLLETPEQIGGVIDSYLSRQSLPQGNSLVVGYNHSQDLASRLCNDLGPEIGSGLVDCSLVGGNWDNATLFAKQFSNSPLNYLQFVNVDSTHQAYGKGANPITAGGISTNPVNLAGSIIFLSGDHAGLNVPANSNFSLDLVEGFASRNAYVLGSTGYVYVGPDILWTERLIRIYEEEITRGFSATIGDALVEAKRRYYLENNSRNAYDSKVVQQTVLYGLPMYAIQTYASLGPDPFPGVGISITLGFEQSASPHSVESPVVGSIEINVPYGQNHANTISSPSDAYQPVTTTTGIYYALNGHASAEAFGFIEPQYFRNLPTLTGRTFKGMALTGGRYVTATNPPAQAIPIIDSLTPTDQTLLHSEGFSPPLGFDIRNVSGVSQTSSMLSVVMGQNNADTGEQRLFTQIKYDIYTSASGNSSGPSLVSLNSYRNRQSGLSNFKVEAVDDSKVDRVLITYTSGNGVLESINLSFDPTTNKWMGKTVMPIGTSYIVQLVDDVGNTVVIAPYEGYFSLPEVDIDSSGFQVYLPMLRR